MELDRDAPWFQGLVERFGEPRVGNAGIKDNWLTWTHSGRKHFINFYIDDDFMQLNIFSKGRLTWECRTLPSSEKMQQLLDVTEFGQSW